MHLATCATQTHCTVLVIDRQVAKGVQIAPAQGSGHSPLCSTSQQAACPTLDTRNVDGPCLPLSSVLLWNMQVPTGLFLQYARLCAKNGMGKKITACPAATAPCTPDSALGGRNNKTKRCRWQRLSCCRNPKSTTLTMLIDGSACAAQDKEGASEQTSRQKPRRHVTRPRSLTRRQPG